jgi:hypothetical protein
VTLTGNQLVGLACHWPGSTQDAIGDPGQEAIASRLRAYRDYHVNVRGWSDIGYNMAIDQGGRVWDCRGITRVGAHCASRTNPDANHEWVGVLFIVGDSEPLTPAATRAFQEFRYSVFLEHWPGRTRLTGHGRAPGVPGAQTSCPGPHVAAELPDGALADRPNQEDDMTPEEHQLLVDTASLARFAAAGVARLEDTDAPSSVHRQVWAIGAGKNVSAAVGRLDAALPIEAARHSEVLAAIAAIPAEVVNLDDAALTAIAAAVADEQARRLVG